MNKRTLLLGGLAVAAVAGALKNRERVAGLIGVRTGGSQPPAPDSVTYASPEQTRSPVPTEPAPPPAPANYDLGGPAANTSTAVPAPDPLVHGEGAIDEQAEERAAAAEAAAIGGTTPEYAGFELGEVADEEERAVVEAGGGDAEGQEQAEADLRDNAEPAAGDPIEGGRRIDSAIGATQDPAVGESPEGAVTEPARADGAGLPDESRTGAEPRDPGSRSFFAGGKGDEEPEEGAAPGLPDQGAAEAAERAAGGGTPSERAAGSGTAPERGAGDEAPAERAAGGHTPAEKKSSAVWSRPEGDEDDGDEWQTWSGRAADS